MRENRFIVLVFSVVRMESPILYKTLPKIHHLCGYTLYCTGNTFVCLSGSLFIIINSDCFNICFVGSSSLVDLLEFELVNVIFDNILSLTKISNN